jgi:hypothetical protein
MLSNDVAMFVSGWKSRSSVHVPEQPRSIVFALYLEPEELRVSSRD